MSLLGSTAMLFPLQMSADIYLQPYNHIVDGGHIGQQVRRLTFLSFPDYFISLVCVQLGIVLAPHQLAPGQVEPVNWDFDNHWSIAHLEVFDAGLWPGPGFPVILNPFPTPMASIYVNGVLVNGRLLRWHHESIVTIDDGRDLHYRAHRRRIGHVPLDPLPIRPHGNSRQFRRLIFSTQMQQSRRSGN